MVVLPLSTQSSIKNLFWAVSNGYWTGCGILMVPAACHDVVVGLMKPDILVLPGVVT